MRSTFFSYEESSLVQLLTLSSYLYILIIAGWFAERFLYAGLIAQMTLGLIYGPPLANILPSDWLQTFLALGNLGLILLVFHGGLSTRLDLLKANLVLSITVALVGILVPIGLSLLCFIYLFGATPLQGFTAGAALCSTSLGTTFAILSSMRGTIDLRDTRIGTVLLSAAILDDIVGLIMTSVVSQVSTPEISLHGGKLAWTILQPIAASGGMAVIMPAAVKWAALPLFRRSLAHLDGRITHLRGAFTFVLILVLCAMLAISNFTGSSMLFGAYVSGCALRYLDSCMPGNEASPFQEAFAAHIEPSNERLFVPLFFATIGAAIPFLSLWRGTVIWKGVVYSLLMWAGKATTGLCILFWPTGKETELPAGLDPSTPRPETATGAQGRQECRAASMELAAAEHIASPQNTHIVPSPVANRRKGMVTQYIPRFQPPGKLPVYSALLISLAMVSRGEISLLIAQVGRPTLGEEGFLIVMWAAVLCTFVGAITTGQLVHRKLEKCAGAGWD